MLITKGEIERALNEMIRYEEGPRFQDLAIILAKQKWPGLIASEPKKDLGADALVNAWVAPNGKAMALACSITATLDKVKADAKKILGNFSKVSLLVFATPRPVSTETISKWSEEIGQSFGFDLIVIPRNDIVTSLMQPQNAVLCRTILNIPIDIEPDVSELIERAARSAHENTDHWFSGRRLADQPLIELRASRIENEYPAKGETLDFGNLLAELLRGHQLIIEAPAGRGKTTTLIQLAKRIEAAKGLALLIDLPEWSKSGRDLFEYIGAMPEFTHNGIDAKSLKRISQIERVYLLFNGWNELSAASSEVIEKALQKVSRELPMAGIVVATRAHYMRPPLPDAARVTLVQLTHHEISDYLRAALKEDRADQLLAKLKDNRQLGELARTPFILAAVTKIFEAGRDLPATRIGVLQSVTQVLEEMVEHLNDLRRFPLSGNAIAYLSDLAIQMTACDEVTLSETEARAACSTASRRLQDERQIMQAPEPADVLNALCAHHVLERIEYPTTSFRFGHQQFQEFYAALWLDRELADTIQKGNDAGGFVSKYMNMPSWGEPLRMIAEKIGSDTHQGSIASNAIERGKKLLRMALQVDPIFAADLASAAGAEIWHEMGGILEEHLRAWYSVEDANHRSCALAAMFASGSASFRDLIVPLLTNANNQVSLSAYRVWPKFHLSILGPDWRKSVQEWKPEKRIEFVGELTLNEWRTDVAEYFATKDPDVEVRFEAIKFLSWIGASDEAKRALDALPDGLLSAALLRWPLEEIPTSLHPAALAAYRERLISTTDSGKRAQNLLAQLELGGTNIVEALKAELSQLATGKTDSYGDDLLRRSLTLVQNDDMAWVSEWVARRIAVGALWHDSWRHFVTSIPDNFASELLDKLTNTNLEHRDRPIIALLSAVADVELARKVFSRLVAARRKLDETTQPPDQVIYATFSQLEDLFRSIRPSTSIAAISNGLIGNVDSVELRVITQVFARVGMDDLDLKSELPRESRETLRMYLKKGASIVSSQVDPNGGFAANLARALARVGEPEDVEDVVSLIQADLRRLHDIREAAAKGIHPHGVAVWSTWYVKAVVSLDREHADSVLLSLLNEQDYEVDAAKALLQLASVAKPSPQGIPFKKDYGLIWKAREGAIPIEFVEDRRERYANALRGTVSALLSEQAATSEHAWYSNRLLWLALTLAALDSRRSADLVLKCALLQAARMAGAGLRQWRRCFSWVQLYRQNRASTY